MIREEEDDMTQEMRQFVLLELKQEVDTFIKKIEAAKIPAKNEWEDGLNQGLEWAIRILTKDKSAY